MGTWTCTLLKSENTGLELLVQTYLECFEAFWGGFKMICKQCIYGYFETKVGDIAFCFPGGSDGKEFACTVGDLGSIPGLGGHGTPLQSSCLENPTDRRAWRATVHGVAESDTTERLSTALSLNNRRKVSFPSSPLTTPEPVISMAGVSQPGVPLLKDPPRGEANPQALSLVLPSQAQPVCPHSTLNS